MSRRIKTRRNETGLKAKAMEFLRDRGPHWLVEKRHASGMGVNGLPDLCCTCHGLSAQLELKAKGGQPTPLQAHWLQKYRDAGAVAMWADDLDGVERFAWCVEAQAYKLGLGPKPPGYVEPEP